MLERHRYVSGSSAQQVVSARAGIIQYREGKVFLNSDVPFVQSDFICMDNGQILRTEKGRAEVLLAPDTYLRLDENSALRMEQNRIDDVLLALEEGSALIEVVQRVRGNPMKLRISAGVIEIKEEGLYRLNTNPAEIRVYGGAALILSGNKKTKVKSGREVRPDKGLTSEGFDANVSDALHQWSAKRSFDLFIASKDTRTQNHWRPISMGLVRNFYYRVSFYSSVYDQKIKGTPFSQQPMDTIEEREKALRKAMEESRRK